MKSFSCPESSEAEVGGRGGQERYSDWYYLKLVTDAVAEDGDSADNGTDTSITDQLSLGSCRGAVTMSTQQTCQRCLAAATVTKTFHAFHAFHAFLTVDYKQTI